MSKAVECVRNDAMGTLKASTSFGVTRTTLQRLAKSGDHFAVKKLGSKVPVFLSIWKQNLLNTYWLWNKACSVLQLTDFVTLSTSLPTQTILSIPLIATMNVLERNGWEISYNVIRNCLSECQFNDWSRTRRHNGMVRGGQLGVSPAKNEIWNHYHYYHYFYYLFFRPPALSLSDWNLIK